MYILAENSLYRIDRGKACVKPPRKMWGEEIVKSEDNQQHSL
jgi:hypothetical protein